MKETTQTGLVVTPHPLCLQGQRVYHDAGAAQGALLLPGERLDHLLARHGVEPGQQWRVSIGGVEVAEQHWGLVFPKHGHLIEARRVPEKAVIAIAAIAVLAYFTFGAGGLAAGSAAGGAAGTSAGLFAAGGLIGGGVLAAGAVYIGGSILITKLLAPKALGSRQSNDSGGQAFSLSGGRNRVRQFETMGLVLGQPYCVPDLGAAPYTFFANGEQHLWQLFHFGLNCASVSTLRIGQTALENFAGVQVMRDGFDSGNTGLPVLTSDVDSLAGGLLTAPGAPGAFVTRTSSTNTIMLAVDLEATLYAVNKKGAFVNNSMQVSIEYRLLGGGAWLAFSLDGLVAVTLSNASTRPLRLTFERAVAAGQYEVRCAKLSADQTGSTAVNTVTWLTLKSFQKDLGNYKGQARLALQVQASGQLNGALDELNAVATAKPMPYWNGGAWVTATSRANGLSNPGALFLLLARGIRDIDGRLIAGVGLPDSEIDIEGLKLFMVFCAAHGFTFDLFLQENMSVGELLEQIAASGLGSRSEHTGKLGVIWFSDAQPVEAVLNMTTMKARTFAVEYNTQETADEIEYSYFDRARNNTWKPVRVVAPGVTTPQRTARQTLQGVTDELHAAVLARFAMAQNVYQRKSVSCEVDLEHMTFRRGTVMALSHDLTQWGFGGRVQGAVNNAGILTLTLDDLVPAVSPSGAVSRYIGLRIAGEAQYRIFAVAAFAGSTQTVTLATSWPVGLAVPGDAADNPAHDTIWIYDFKATPGQKLRVTDLSPVGNLDGARVQMTPELAEFWDYVWFGAYVPPPATSLLSQGGPVLSRLAVSEQLGRQGNTFFTELTLSFDSTGRFDHADLWGAVSAGVPALLGTTRNHAVSWRGSLDETWTLELRPYSDLHAGLPAALVYAVVGLAAPPPPFDEFLVLAQPDGTRQYNFSYTLTDTPADWLGAEIRYTPGVVADPDWALMQQLQDGTSYYTASPVEINAPLSGSWTFACRSRDSSGNLSTAKTQSITLSKRRTGNTVDEFFEELDNWPGTLGGFVKIGGVLEALNTGTWATLPVTWDAWTRWVMSPTTPAVYTTLAHDLGITLAGQIAADVVADGLATLELRSGADGVAWSAWGSASSTFSARWVQMRVTLSATVPQPVPVLHKLDYSVVAELKTEYINDVVPAGLLGALRIGVGDIRIPLGNTYILIKRSNTTIQDSRAGQWTDQRIDNALTGPRWQFKLNGVLTDPAFVDFYIEGF